MSNVWLCVLGALVAGWFVLDGFVLGAGIMAPWLADGPSARRFMRTAVGPFLLASEMWLIASAGTLSMAFSRTEATLADVYPVLVVLLAGWMTRDAALWLGRVAGSGRVLDVLWSAGSYAVAFCAGALLATLARGVPVGPAPITTLLGPASVVSGLAMVTLLALHGAVVQRLRAPAPVCEQAEAAIGRLAVIASGLTALAVILAIVAAPVRAAMGPVALLVVASPIAALVSVWRHYIGRPGQAFACTSVAVAVPAVAVGLGLAGRLVNAFADSTLATAALFAVPIIVAHQAWLWWLFRKPVTARDAVFF